MIIKTSLIIFCMFHLVQCGVNDYCPCLTQACLKFSDNPNYPLAPSWSYLFEGDIVNSGLEMSLTLSLYYGYTVKVPERRGKVLFCNYIGRCLSHSFLLLPDWGCVQDFTTCDLGGYTFSFWIKMKANEKARLIPSVPENSTYFIEFPGQGMSIWYDHYKELWNVSLRHQSFATYIDFSGNNVERWHQVAAVASKTKELSAYLDSKLMGTKSMTSQQQTWTKIDPTDMFSGVGKNPPNGRYWIDDFKMWTKPFSAQEIEVNYIDDGDELCFSMGDVMKDGMTCRGIINKHFLLHILSKNYDPFDPSLDVPKK